MILAEKILSLRRGQGWSQEELAEKLHVSRQSVSKWESAAAIPDINKILEMARLFGMTTDYLLKDELVQTQPTDDPDTVRPAPLSLEQAEACLREERTRAGQLALGTALCILSPVPLILQSIQESPGGDAVYILGIGAMFLMIAAAVMLFIFSVRHSHTLRAWQARSFEPDYGVGGILGEKYAAFQRLYWPCMALGVALCILCVLPVTFAGLLDVSDAVVICMSALLFVIVAAGVYLLVFFGVRKRGYRVLSQAEPPARDIPAREGKSARLAGIYWPAVAAVYLAWSLLTSQWGISWIIWPVAALLFVSITGILNTMRAGKKQP